MSQYGQLNKLLKEHNEFRDDAAAFYNSIQIIIRSKLDHWIEKQNWSALLSADSSLTDSEVKVKANDLLEEAIRQLQTIAHSSSEDTETLLFTHAESSLRNSYCCNPLQFVKDVDTCLRKERDLIARMSQQIYQLNQSRIPTAHSQTNYSETQLTKAFEDITGETEAAFQTLEWADKILAAWTTDIENQSLVERDVLGTGQIHQAPYEAFQKLKTGLMTKLENAIGKFFNELPNLEPYILRWKNHQLYQQLCRRPEQNDDVSDVEPLCVKAFTILSNLFQCVVDARIQKVNSVTEHLPGSLSIIPRPSALLNLEVMLKGCMERLIKMCLVVFVQPPITMITEKERVAGRDRDTSEVNYSKKFNTSVGLLGGSGLEGVLEITEVNIILMFREDIAAYLKGETNRNSSVFSIHNDKVANRRSTDRRNSDCEQKCCMKMYEGVRVENFSRREQKNVYKQICHAIYDVVFESSQTSWKFEARTLSLPIIVRTGANQASEHKGAQLWYGFSAHNVYDVLKPVASELPLEQVVQMMDERIRFIGGRGLMDYEKKFLREKLGCAAKSGKSSREPRDKITLDAFIKEKVQLASHPGGPVDTVTSFSLWRWFHCIVNLLEGELKNPWKDGVIFGFASRDQCDEALEKKMPGTCLIRFSESCVEGNHENSKGRIGVVLKTAEGVHYAPPISSEKIQSPGLSVMIRNTIVNERIPEILLPTMCAIDDLRKYDPPQENDEPSTGVVRYLDFSIQVVATKKLGELSISSPQHSVGPDSPAGSTSSVPSRKILKGKRSRGNKTTTGGSKQRYCPPESPESPTSSLESPPMAFPCSPMPQFCAVGIMQNASSPHNDSNPFSFSNIPVTVMENDGFNLQLLVENNAETMDERDEVPLDEDIANLLTPEMISSFLGMSQNTTAVDNTSNVE